MEYLYWLTHQFGSADSVLSYRAWYDALQKPFFAPEPWVFGFAWGIIYPLIFIALAYALFLGWKRLIPAGYLQLFALNLALNLTFTPTLIVSRDNTLISLHIVLVLGTLAWLVMRSWRVSKIITFLLVPYLVWGAFATVLQLAITAMN